MIDLKIDSNFGEVNQQLVDLAKEIPFAAALTLTNVGYLIRDAEREGMTVFDRPTPWLQKTIYVDKATTKNMVATVGPTDWFSRGGFNAFRTPWEYVLSHHVEGGVRVPKPAELRLRQAGILKPGQFTVFGPSAKLNAYGNLRAGEWNKILSNLQAAEFVSGYNANTPASKRYSKYGNVKANQYQLLYGKGGPYGIGFIKGRQRFVVLWIVNHVNYNARYDYFGIARRVFNSSIGDAMSKALDKVINRRTR